MEEAGELMSCSGPTGLSLEDQHPTVGGLVDGLEKLVALGTPLVGYPIEVVLAAFHFDKAVMHGRSPQSESPATCYGGGAGNYRGATTTNICRTS